MPIKAYFDPRLISMIFLGIACGLPSFLTVSTLYCRLWEAGFSMSWIGLFSLISLPHGLKFLIGPVVDRISLPFLSSYFGRRRSWILFTQIIMMVAIVGLGLSSPKENLFMIIFWGLIVSSCSAFDHISITSYRIEILEKNQQILGANFTIVGYRIGNLISGAGALVLASYFSWEIAYCLIACCGLIGVITILMSPEPISSPKDTESLKLTLLSFLDFIKMDKIFWILFFVVSFRLGDHLISGFSNNFYESIGFSKIEIANIIKIYGIIPTILGGIIGGMVTIRIGIRKSLLLFGTLEAISPFLYLLQFYTGKNFEVLYFSITLGQLTTGMAASIFMSYIAYLCSNTHITATRYSQLSSIKSLGGVCAGPISGVIIDLQGWPVFFITCTLVSLPCLFMLIKMQDNFPLSLDYKK